MACGWGSSAADPSPRGERCASAGCRDMISQIASEAGGAGAPSGRGLSGPGCGVGAERENCLPTCINGPLRQFAHDPEPPNPKWRIRPIMRTPPSGGASKDSPAPADRHPRNGVPGQTPAPEGRRREVAEGRPVFTGCATHGVGEAPRRRRGRLCCRTREGGFRRVQTGVSTTRLLPQPASAGFLPCRGGVQPARRGPGTANVEQSPLKAARLLPLVFLST
jgi:hypothetical protein